MLLRATDNAVAVHM